MTFTQSQKTHLTLCFIAILATLTLYSRTFLSMVEIWSRSGTFAHGFLIAPIALYLAWTKRDALANTPFRTSFAGLGLVVVGVLLWIVSVVASVQVTEQFAATLILAASIIATLGLSVARVLWFPLLYLFFAVPFGDFLIPYLMEVTADFTTWAVALLGIPIYREGLYFSLPSGNFEVAAACSGVRYLIASIALGAIYSYQTYATTRKRLLFMAAAVLAPILANGLRALGVVLIAHFSGMKYAVGVDHVIFGWLLFGVFLLMVFWLGNKFADDVKPVGKVATETTTTTGKGQLAGLFACLLLLLVLGPMGRSFTMQSDPLAATEFGDLPLELSGNYVRDMTRSKMPFEPKLSGDAANRLAYYMKNGRDIFVSVTHYTSQAQGAELINANNELIPLDEWRRFSLGAGKIEQDGSGYLPVQYMRIEDGVQRFLLAYWYVVDGRESTSEVETKFYEAVNRLVGTHTVTSLYIVGASSSSDDDSTVWLDEFLSQNYDRIKTSQGL